MSDAVAVVTGGAGGLGRLISWSPSSRTTAGGRCSSRPTPRPHWIGLDRAVAEYEQLSSAERVRSGGLVDPRLVADTVVALAFDESAAGRGVMLRPGQEPYAVDPGAADPTSG